VNAHTKSISAVIITLNEERNIARCIESLLPIADEIIVADSGSSDNTKKICENYGVRFVMVEWEGYATTKNKANQLAEYDYILSIDADEEVSEELRESILQAKHSGLSGAYSFNRRTNYCGHWVRFGGWYPDVKVRLFPQKHAYWEGKWVHERLVFKNPLDIKHLKGDLLHYSFESVKDHWSKTKRYNELQAQELFEKNIKVPVWLPAVKAFAKFFQIYILKLGILDGWAGWKIAVVSAKGTIYKYQVLRDLFAGIK
jgi:glycosyltransferase involved in cell wall biosynthesis